MQNYSTILLNFNEGDIITTNIHYINEKKKYTLILNFIVKKWPKENNSFEEFGKLFFNSIIKPRFITIMHPDIKFIKIVFKINAKIPYSSNGNYTYLLPRNTSGTLTGTLDLNKIYRLQIQKANSVHCNWISIRGVPNELSSWPPMTEVLNDTKTENKNTNKTNDNTTVKQALALNNALCSLENLFILPIELSPKMSIQFCLIERKKIGTYMKIII